MLIDREAHDVSLSYDEAEDLVISLDERDLTLSEIDWRPGMAQFRAVLDDEPFTAEVIGITQLSEGRYEITLDLAEPVDVVTFDSFSNFRSRVRKTVDAYGRSFDKTSDGVPHLALRLG